RWPVRVLREATPPPSARSRQPRTTAPTLRVAPRPHLSTALSFRVISPRASCLHQPPDVFLSYTSELDDLRPCARAGDNGNASLGDTESIGKEFHQCSIGGAVHRRGREPHPERVTVHARDPAVGRGWLNAN